MTTLLELTRRVTALEATEVPVISGGGGGAPDNAEYLVLTLDGNLTAERRLVFGAEFSTTDGGADGDYDVDLATTAVVAGSYGAAAQVSTFTVNSKGRLTAAGMVSIAISAAAITGGTLAAARGGTGVSNTGTLTVGANTTISGGGTIALAGFTATVPATGTTAMGAGTLTAATANNVATANHTHAITSTSNGVTTPSTIAAFSAGGALTGSDFFTDDGGLIGISGDVQIKFDSTNGYIDLVLKDAAGAGEVRVVDSGGTAVATTDSDGNGYFAGDMYIGRSSTNLLDILGVVRTSNTTNDTTNKIGYWLGRHYDNAEEDVVILISSNRTGNNTLNFGGNSGSYNTVTEIDFFTASNTTTLTGTRRMRITNSGNILIGTTTDNGYRLDIDAGAQRFAEMIAPSAPAANGVVLFAQDNGSGKTQLMALFATGTAQQVAIQP